MLRLVDKERDFLFAALMKLVERIGQRQCGKVQRLPHFNVSAPDVGGEIVEGRGRGGPQRCHTSAIGAGLAAQ